MKKAERAKERKPSRKALPATKGKRSPKNVEEYFARLPERAQSNLQKVRAVIRSVVPADTTETISYGIPAFKHKKVLVWYAAFANHWSLFPTAAVVEQFKDELKGYITSKGTIRLPMDKPVPTALIKKLVKARLARI
jgi:uncharacterized protein YdhG (YjbR/CyaY superfamily)